MDARAADLCPVYGSQPAPFAAAPDPALPAPVADGHRCWAQVFANPDRVAALIRRDARRMHLPASDLEDVVGDALCQALAKQDEYDPTRPLVPWLRGFGRRAIVARLKARSGEYDGSTHAQDHGALHDRRELGPEEQAHANETGVNLHALLRSAPSRYREVLAARFWKGMRVAAVAEGFGVSEKTIERRLARALRWLEARWRSPRDQH